jgi:hypothetical protein
MIKKYFTIVLLIASLILNAQSESDTITSPVRDCKDLIFPSVISLTGVTIQLTGKKREFQNFLHREIGKTDTKIDNYVQYLPAIQVVAGGFVGLRSDYHWFERTKYLLISQAISSILTVSLKYITHVQRPDDGSFNSFPSGHTNLTFVGAENLYQAYKGSSPLYAYSGYVIGVTVATLRMTNNKHWLSDVAFGAGMGMLVSRLVYHWKPLKNWNPFRKKKNIAMIVVPVYSGEYLGASMQISF